MYNTKIIFYSTENIYITHAQNVSIALKYGNLMKVLSYFVVAVDAFKLNLLE